MFNSSLEDADYIRREAEGKPPTLAEKHEQFREQVKARKAQQSAWWTT